MYLFFLIVVTLFFSNFYVKKKYGLKPLEGYMKKEFSISVKLTILLFPILMMFIVTALYTILFDV